MLIGVLLILLVTWLWATLSLFKIYSVGPEVYFSIRYKAKQRKTTPELRRIFNRRLALLWLMEALLIVGGFIWMLLFLQNPL